MLGLGISSTADMGWAASTKENVLLSAFQSRISADGGSVEDVPCLSLDIDLLLSESSSFTTGLLEFYPGAAAAYSLRQLRRSVSPYAIRVRKSGGAEQDIGFNSNGELDTNALLDFADGGDAWVTTWYDQSSNGNDAEQSTEDSQPQIVSSGSLVTENGKPALQFDGVNDGLNCSTDLRASTGASTVIMTRNMDIQSEFSNIFSFYKVQRHVVTIIGDTVYNNLSIGTNETAGEYIKFPSVDVTGQHLFFSTWDGSSQTGGVDDVKLYSDSSAQSISAIIGSFATTVSGTNSIGYRHDTNSQFGNGTIQEVIVYLTDESSNRTGIESNINDFYSIYS